MYLNYYNLKLKPFQITTDPRFLWLGEKHKEALSTLEYGISGNKGFVLLTGEVGTGKTVLTNSLVDMLDMKTVAAAITDPGLEKLDFFNLLSSSFNFNKKFESKGEFLIHLRDFLHKAYSNNQKVLIIIDEAQRLSNELLEEIRLLSNIELYDSKLINIFFVGQNEFNETLLEKKNRAVAQRITLKYNITPLNEKETVSYIHHRLKIAGTEKKIFNKKALREVFIFSEGIPRLINIICDYSLLTGYSRDKKIIDETIVKECAGELRMPVKEEKKLDVLQKKIEKIKTEPSDKINHDSSVKIKRGEGKDYEKKEKTAPAKRSFFITFLYFVLILSLVIAGGYYFKTHKKPGEKKQWDIDELTPKRFKESLYQKEKTLKVEISDKKFPPKDKKELVVSPAELQNKTDDTKAAASPDLNKTDLNKVDLNKKYLGKIFELMIKGKGKEANQTDTESAAKADTEPASYDNLKDMISNLSKHNNKVLIPFGLDSNDIPDKGFKTLDILGTLMLQYPETEAVIKGYTDAQGGVKYNIRVSEFRANIVKIYLVGKGIDAKRIKATGMGQQNPIASNDTLEGKKANRRVEIEFVVKNEDLF